MKTVSSTVLLVILVVLLVDYCQAAKFKCNTACPAIIRPVCGSNGITYDNSCLLKYAACSSGKYITVVHDGPCKKCPLFCTFEYAPVCASDGLTYGNLCEMKVAACRKNVTLKVVHFGRCRV